MAMITCPECGREVSDKAASCPNCGAPINNFLEKRFCKYCGEQIDKKCVVCPKCEKQAEDIGTNTSNIIINNSSSASAAASATVQPIIYGRPKNKWIAFFLCLFTICGRKFYGGKAGILYLFTVGLFGIGWIIDLISLALKPNPYYV